jgi:hypothetical protein
MFAEKEYDRGHDLVEAAYRKVVARALQLKVEVEEWKQAALLACLNGNHQILGLLQEVVGGLLDPRFLMDNLLTTNHLLYEDVKQCALKLLPGYRLIGGTASSTQLYSLCYWIFTTVWTQGERLDLVEMLYPPGSSFYGPSYDLGWVFRSAVREKRCELATTIYRSLVHRHLINGQTVDLHLLPELLHYCYSRRSLDLLKNLLENETPYQQCHVSLAEAALQYSSTQNTTTTTVVLRRLLEEGEQKLPFATLIAACRINHLHLAKELLPRVEPGSYYEIQDAMRHARAHLDGEILLALLADTNYLWYRQFEK